MGESSARPIQARREHGRQDAQNLHFGDDVSWHSHGADPVPHAYRLHYGKSRKALAEVIPDDEHAGMWRIRWPDDQLSDMVNLTRAKDAARVLAMRNVASGDSLPLRWIRDTGESP
jgi:hypothetical protein